MGSIKDKFHELQGKLNAVSEGYVEELHKIKTRYHDAARPFREELAALVSNVTVREMLEEISPNGKLGVLEELIFRKVVDKKVTEGVDPKLIAALSDPAVPVNEAMEAILQQRMGGDANPLKDDDAVKEHQLADGVTLYDISVKSPDELRGFLRGKFGMTDAELDGVLRRMKG